MKSPCRRTSAEAEPARRARHRARLHGYRRLDRAGCTTVGCKVHARRCVLSRKRMRAIWCSVVAVCLLVAGGHAQRIEQGQRGSHTLHAPAAVSASHARRASSSVGPYLAPSCSLTSEPVRAAAVAELLAPHERPILRVASSRTSRGPPV